MASYSLSQSELARQAGRHFNGEGNSKMRRTQITAIAGLALLAPLAGCAVDSAVEGEPGGEGPVSTVTVACGNVEELCESVIAQFTESTGIPANYVRMSGGEILARLESTEGAANAEFDAWWGGPAESYAAGAERGLLAPYDSPARADIAPDLMDENALWTGYALNPNGLCSNKAILDNLGVDAPEAWNDLLDPKLKQNIATSHPATAGTGYGFLTTIIANHSDDIDAAFDWMLKLHPNVLQYTKSGAAPVQMLVRGEIATAPAVMSVCERERVTNGNEDIVMTYPEEGVGFELAAVAVVKGAKNVDGAQKFVDWALTPEALEAHYAIGYHSFPTLAAGGENGLGQSVEDIPWAEGFDPTGMAFDRTALSARFDSEIAPAPTE